MNKTAIQVMNQRYRPLRTSSDLCGSAITTTRMHPPADLTPYVMEFWEYTVDPILNYVPVQVFPNACLSIRFNVKPYEVESILYGPSACNNMKGLFFSDWVIFGAALWPAYSYQLLGLSLQGIRDLRIHLDCIWPQENSHLCEQIGQAQDMPSRVDVLSDFLRRKLRARPPQADFLNAYKKLVSEASYHTDISPIANAAQTSGRSLRRHFHKYLGLGPKEMHRLIRVQRALKQLSCSKNHSLANLATELGFSDQAHLGRSFKEFVGVTPARFTKLVGNMQDATLDIWSDLNPATKDRPSPKVSRFT